MNFDFFDRKSENKTRRRENERRTRKEKEKPRVNQLMSKMKEWRNIRITELRIKKHSVISGALKSHFSIKESY